MSDPPGQRILIDATMAKGGGGYTYLVNILPALHRRDPGRRLLVVTADEGVHEAVRRCEGVEIRHLGQIGAAGRLRYSWWRSYRLARQWRADVYFSVGEIAPLFAPCPVIAAFRNPNAFTWSRGQGFPLRQQVRLWLLYGMALASAFRCRRIIFVSADSARWIGDSLRLPERKRSVVHHGIDRSRWAGVSKDSDGPGAILSVSSVYPYKNYVRLIEAYALLRERRADVPDLVIAGDDQDPPYSRRMEEARRSTKVADSIHILGKVPYEEIRQHYARASVFVFPSWLETFGHPLLEAMATSTPVVASDIPVFREVAGDAAAFADPHDPMALADAMESVLFDRELAARLVERGHERVREFSWDRSAERLLATIDEAVGRG